MGRKHVATGQRPPGGKRPGAGRPKGSANTLELGEVKALKAIRLRVPKDADPEVAQLADRALQRIVEVMEEGVSPLHSRAVLAAATRIREEACGPLTQRLEHTGADGGPLVVEIREFTEAPAEEVAASTCAAVNPNASGDEPLTCTRRVGHMGGHSWEVPEVA